MIILKNACLIQVFAALASFITYAYCEDFNSSFSYRHLEYLRSECKSLFNHAWRSYMNHGFPADEVRPISCEKYGPDFKNPYNKDRNDPLGNYSSTALDNIDSLIIMEEWDQLEYILDYLKTNKETIFNQNTIVQVFESTVRALGGLLSAHLLLTDVTNNKTITPRYEPYKRISYEYDGFLLDIAHDLGLRLIPAFKTQHNIPLPRINLAEGVRGVPVSMQSETCASGAMTPVLEFTLLSKLTGDTQFEYYSQLAFWKLWYSKSQLNLLPMTINPMTNEWVDEVTGIGASIDSFYEYAAKASIVFDDDYMWKVFETSYKALLVHSAQGGGPHQGAMLFPNILASSGLVATLWLDSLSGFWPGLQVLTGQLSDAIRTHLVFLKIWDCFDSIPERWNHDLEVHRVRGGNVPLSMEDVIPLEWYPLRPEFIESTYYLYRATRDPMYLKIGERILYLFKNKYKSECGFHGLQNVRTGEPQDRMETFVMSESLKYLYLLFDTNDQIFLHTDLMKGKNWVFSTEAHPLWFNKQSKPNKQYNGEEDEIIDFKQTKLDSFLFNIRRVNPHKKELTSLNETVYYRNISLPEVPYFDIPNHENAGYIEKTDAYEKRYSMCETTPFKPIQKSFMSSAYYSWDQLFEPDLLFQRTLVRPNYRNKTQLDGSYIELSSDFYQKYSLFAPQDDSLYLQSACETTSEQFEIIFGDVSEINTVEISRLRFTGNASYTPDQYVFLENDLWVPHTNGLRMKMEKLRPGDLDSRKQFVSQDYVDSIAASRFKDDNGVCDASLPEESASASSYVLRILKINGLFVDPGCVVWTLPFESADSHSKKPPAISIASDGRVLLHGTVIENMMVYSG